MKAIYIDFVAPQGRKYVWGVACIVVVALVAVYGVRVWSLTQQKAEVEARLATLTLQQRQSAAQPPAEENKSDNPKAASEAAALHLRQWDWNRVYDAIETPALTKTRLVQMGVDAQSGQITLQFELDSMTQAAQVTEALNSASQPGAVWRLERLENATHPSATSGMGTSIKGVWLGMLP